MRSNQRRALAGAIALAAAVGLTACGDSDASDDSGSGSGQIELTIGTFTEFGYEDLLKEYEDAHPNIKITHHKTGQGGPYHQQLLTKLAANSGLEDVVAIEEGHLPDVIDKPQLFNNLADIGPKDVKPDRWLDWKYQAGTAKDGTWIGYGTDIGPLAMCYRTDLLAAAEHADRRGVGEGHVRSRGTRTSRPVTSTSRRPARPWFDSDVADLQRDAEPARPEGYLTKDDKLAIESNKDIKSNWDQVTAAGGRRPDREARRVQPGVEHRVQAGRVRHEDLPVLDARRGQGAGRPGERRQVGGHRRVPRTAAATGAARSSRCPSSREHPKEAAELAAWLTAPEQQIKAFEKTGNFPSQVEALDVAGAAGQHQRLLR